MQTARIAAQRLGRHEVHARRGALGGGSVEDVLTLLARFPASGSVALVGHEPQVSELLGHLVGSNDAARLAFKKGGVAVVDLPEGTRSRGTAGGVPAARACCVRASSCSAGLRRRRPAHGRSAGSCDDPDPGIHRGLAGVADGKVVFCQAAGLTVLDLATGRVLLPATPGGTAGNCC